MLRFQTFGHPTPLCFLQSLAALEHCCDSHLLARPCKQVQGPKDRIGVTGKKGNAWMHAG